MCRYPHSGKSPKGCRSKITDPFPGRHFPSCRWVNVGSDFENNSKNKLRTEYPRTRWKTVKQPQCKSLRGKDGPLISLAHNPKVPGSNPGPATTSSDRHKSLSSFRLQDQSSSVPLLWLHREVENRI